MSLARYVWAGPNTLIGLIFVPVVWLSRGGAQVVDGVLELYGGALAPLLRHVVPLDGGAAAITFGHVVLARDRRALTLTRAHERAHVRQYELWGPFFIPAYILASLWAAVKGKGAYHGNAFEEQARRLETE
jgi:hypothetical protein